MKDNQKFLTVSEAGDLLKVKKQTIYNLVYQGKIKFFKPNKKTLYFLESDLINYIKGGE